MYGTDLLVVDWTMAFTSHIACQRTRHTIGPVDRKEILDRLLELNHARCADEVKSGLHNKKPCRKRPSMEAAGETLFDM
jgi:hypothetical protein